MSGITPWTITDFYQLLPVVERIAKPATYLVDTLFPNVIMSNMTNGYMAVEYRRQGRYVAPYVVKGARGTDINRSKSKVKLYRAPLVAPRRVLTPEEIELRRFGETPIYSTMSDMDRAAKMQADDLQELLRMVYNRKNQQAAEILQTGKATIRGFADDGREFVEDELIFDWDGAVDASSDWSNSTADIYGDIKAVSEKIQEDAGIVPTLMICGKNVARKLLRNEEILNWLTIPNRENLAMANFAPTYTSPQTQFIGQISALNLTVLSYSETYTDLDGQVKPFIDPDNAIICVPNSGRQLYGAVTFLDAGGQWQTVSAPHVPVYRFDADAQNSSLTLFSRFLMCPAEISDWCCIKTKL